MMTMVICDMCLVSSLGTDTCPMEMATHGCYVVVMWMVVVVSVSVFMHCVYDVMHVYMM